MPTTIARPGQNGAASMIGPVVISENHYQPTVAEDEFVELRNTTGEPVNLFDPLQSTNCWRMDGLGFSFATNATMAAHGFFLLTRGDPEVFRARHAIPRDLPIGQ